MEAVVLSELADKELIKLFLKGSEEAFGELISRYETKVYNLAMRLTRNEDDAEEVLQDVFVTLYKKLASFEGKSAFSSWLYRITANAAFMKLRKRKNKSFISLEDFAPYSRLAQTVDKDYRAKTDSRIMNGEMREALEQAIGKLPEDYRAVFLMRDVDGLSNKEVADIMNISIPAVKSRLHRSRMMLRRKLKRWYDLLREDSDYCYSTVADSVGAQWTNI